MRGRTIQIQYGTPWPPSLSIDPYMNAAAGSENGGCGRSRSNRDHKISATIRKPATIMASLSRLDKILSPRCVFEARDYRLIPSPSTVEFGGPCRRRL